MTVHKQRIKTSFDAAASQYDEAANVQRQVADALAARILALPLPAKPRVLEFGCGTGFLTRTLRRRLANASWTVTDISEPMVRQCMASLHDKTNMVFKVMDGEHPTLKGPFDLICSNLSAQWFEDLGGSLEKLGALLAPKGHMAFSTLANETFKEWREAHANIGLVSAVPRYPNLEDLRFDIPRARYEEQLISVSYRSGKDFLASLKALGAATPAPGTKPLSPGDLKRVLDKFDERRDRSITYHIAYGIYL